MLLWSGVKSSLNYSKPGKGTPIFGEWPSSIIVFLVMGFFMVNDVPIESIIGQMKKSCTLLLIKYLFLQINQLDQYACRLIKINQGHFGKKCTYLHFLVSTLKTISAKMHQRANWSKLFACNYKIVEMSTCFSKNLHLIQVQNGWLLKCIFVLGKMVACRTCRLIE